MGVHTVTMAIESATRVPRRLTVRRHQRAAIDAAMFVGPFLVVYAVFVLWPVVQAFRMSLYDWDLLGAAREFVGLGNYRRMLWGQDMTWSLEHLLVLRVVAIAVAALVLVRRVRRRARTWVSVAIALGGLGFVAFSGFHPRASGSWNDLTFWISLKNTLVFTAWSTPIIVGLGLALAIAIDQARRGGAWYRAVFFLPYVLPISVVTLIWSYLLNPDRGLVGGVLGWFGKDGIAFLSDPQLAMPSIVATTVWWGVGFNLVLFLAGLQDIPTHLYEAAALDGAGWWQRFRYVTVPGLARVLVLVTVVQFIASFQIFGQVHIMTRGGPGTATRVLVEHIYETGFRDFRIGYAAAMSVFLFVVMAAVSAVQFKSFEAARS
jgi:multiple sugar transport system permease protein